MEVGLKPPERKPPSLVYSIASASGQQAGRIAGARFEDTTKGVGSRSFRLAPATRCLCSPTVCLSVCLSCVVKCDQDFFLVRSISRLPGESWPKATTCTFLRLQVNALCGISLCLSLCVSGAGSHSTRWLVRLWVGRNACCVQHKEQDSSR